MEAFPTGDWRTTHRAARVLCTNTGEHVGRDAIGKVVVAVDIVVVRRSSLLVDVAVTRGIGVGFGGSTIVSWKRSVAG